MELQINSVRIKHARPVSHSIYQSDKLVRNPGRVSGVIFEFPLNAFIQFNIFSDRFWIGLLYQNLLPLESEVTKRTFRLTLIDAWLINEILRIHWIQWKGFYFTTAHFFRELLANLMNFIRFNWSKWYLIRFKIYNPKGKRNVNERHHCWKTWISMEICN